MRILFFLLLFWNINIQAVFSQEYGYTHYDSKDGLAGSTVYCMVQDRDGFIWFGTEGGLSRFDGTHFKNFTREDGLPDNEIIKLFADSKGRIWIAPFKKSVCYYYRGKIYTQENDNVLKQIHTDDFVIKFVEDSKGNILLQETKKIYQITPDGRVELFDRINDRPVTYINLVSANPNGGFRVVEGNRVYDFNNKKFYLKRTNAIYNNHFIYFDHHGNTQVWRSDSLHFKTINESNNKLVTFDFKWNHLRFIVLNDSLVAQCCNDGAFIYNMNNPGVEQVFLPGQQVSNVMVDTENSTWFSTLGHGVFKLSTPNVLNNKVELKGLPSQVYAFAWYKESILAATEFPAIYRFNRRTGTPDKKPLALMPGVNPVLALSVYKNNQIFCGTGFRIYRTTEAGWPLSGKDQPGLVVKGLHLLGDSLYVANKDNVLLVDPVSFKIKDTVWHERATAVFACHDTVYIGTLSGLYYRLPNKEIVFPGDKLPALKTRITAIQEDTKGILWVGTYGDGIIGYRNGRIVATINRKSGLTGNVCRVFYLCGNWLWVGTDKGLNKINLAAPGYPVVKYTTGDGLSSDIINAVHVDSNKVFVGTPAGMTFFDEEQIIRKSRCDLNFTDITVGGITYYPSEAPVVIPHIKNSITFNFVGISFKSNGDVRYRYRLLGLDSAWHETRETFLSYPTLPSGDYELQLQAFNKFEVPSKLLIKHFAIDKLIYERTWFRVLLSLLFLAVVGISVSLIIRRIRKREQEKTAISKRISELEQLSRKAQMNPHFIFNSLNSIQQYVMDADVAGANKFISGFSRLIRQTLDFSSKPEISLQEELDYLTNYLDIERTRLEDTFSWRVNIDKAVDPAEYYIPPMILQPFVENSVRHGLRFRRDKNGVVTIAVTRKGDYLICVLEDNGVGRKAAMQYKSISPINYQSKGLSLTAERIEMFNKEHEQKITMHIDDLEDEAKNALGTRVTISFPVL
jgi:ligand-binding sensor domain-containing protein